MEQYLVIFYDKGEKRQLTEMGVRDVFCLFQEELEKELKKRRRFEIHEIGMCVVDAS